MNYINTGLFTKTSFDVIYAFHKHLQLDDALEGMTSMRSFVFDSCALRNCIYSIQQSDVDILVSNEIVIFSRFNSVYAWLSYRSDTRQDTTINGLKARFLKTFSLYMRVFVKHAGDKVKDILARQLEKDGDSIYKNLEFTKEDVLAVADALEGKTLSPNLDERIVGHQLDPVAYESNIVLVSELDKLNLDCKHKVEEAWNKFNKTIDAFKTKEHDKTVKIVRKLVDDSSKKKAEIIRSLRQTNLKAICMQNSLLAFPNIHKEIRHVDR